MGGGKIRKYKLMGEKLEAGDGIEPTIKALQASALPLCYPAKVIFDCNLQNSYNQ